MTARLEPEIAEKVALEREKQSRAAAFKRRVWKLRAVLLPIFALVALAGFSLRTGEVVGRSMEPAFLDGQRFLIFSTYRYVSPLRVGDVVVVKRKRDDERDTEIVKRIVFIQNATGDAPLPEVIQLSSGKYRFAEAFPETLTAAGRIPPNGVLVMGDNVNNSVDSRVFGPVYPYEIVGKVFSMNRGAPVSSRLRSPSPGG